MARINSIKIKVSVPVIVILMIVFVVTSLVFIQRESELAFETTIASAESFSELSVEGVVTGYTEYYESGYFLYAEIISELLETNEDIVRVRLVHVDGTVLFDSLELESGKYDEGSQGVRVVEDAQLLEMLLSIGAQKTEYSSSSDSFEIVQPYLDDFSRHEYAVIYSVSLARLAEVEQEMQSNIFYYSALSFVASLLIIYFLFSYHITSPLNRLVGGVKKIGKGDLEYQIDVKSHDELGDLADEFNKMTRDLKASNEEIEQYSRSLELMVEQRNQLIIQISHDLKTPLGPINTMASLLQKKEEEPAKREMLEVIKRNAEYMKNIVVKTIELVRLNTPEYRLELEEISLEKMVGKILATKRHSLSEKQVEMNVEVGEDIVVVADRLAVEELLTNVIENAVKYNVEGGSISVTATRDDVFVEVVVSDTGIGMTKEQIDRVFNEFYKADESRHDVESSGLGMAIVRRIVELHGGRVWLESEGLGKGIAVHFTLPVKSS